MQWRRPCKHVDCDPHRLWQTEPVRARLINIGSRIGHALAALALTLLAGCGGSGGGSAPPNPAPDPCATAGQVVTVTGFMEDLYFWNDEPEQSDKYLGLDTNNFADADELLDFLRYRPDEFDRLFTHITTVAEDNQFFGPGQFVGYGFSFWLDETTMELWITQVFAGSPAKAAGFARGRRILTIDGRTIAEIEAAEGVGEAFGESELGVTQQFTLQETGSPPFDTSATKALVTIDPVPQHRIIDIGGRKIGYFEFRPFIDTSRAALQTVFANFAMAGVTDVIVDVRYNGGGLVDVAENFASLLAGPANVGNVQSFTRFNQANNGRDQPANFTPQANSIDLDSIVFITTGGSASATELVINSLNPYFGVGVGVALVGDRTFGKPVGQIGKDYCEQRLRLVAFEVVNVNNEGGFFDGLPVDCPADDEFAFAIGDELEDSLATALTLITTGACPIVGVRGGATLQSADDPPARRQFRNDSAAREFSYAY